MSDTLFRHGKKRFYDSIKFPRGFAKSGDFTLAEEEMLSLYGDTMLGLELGLLQAENSEEKHFLKAIAHPGKAKSKLERVWLKYTQLARGRKRFHTLNGRSRSPSEFADDYSDDGLVLEEA